MPAPRRICIVRLSHLGDVVHALPVYHALRAAHPSSELAWVTQAEYAELLSGLPGLARVMVFERRGGLGAWPSLRRELAGFGADWTVDAQGNTKSAMVTLCTGAARRSGLHPLDWRERFGAHVLTDHPAAPAGGGRSHAVERALQLARHVAPEAPRAAAECSLPVDPDALARGAERVREWLDGADEPAWVLHLAAPGDPRSWPLEHFVAVARALLEAGARVLLLSGPAETEAGRRARALLGERAGLIHWTGQRGLPELAGFFAAAARAGARLLACDSGPLHVAAACGLPVVALAGPQDEARTGPWPTTRAPGGPHAVLRASDSPPCAPCLAQRCTHERGPVCMERLAPRDVVAGLLAAGSASAVH